MSQISVFTPGADENVHETEELTDTAFMISTTLGNDSVFYEV